MCALVCLPLGASNIFSFLPIKNIYDFDGLYALSLSRLGDDHSSLFELFIDDLLMHISKIFSFHC